jgi:alkanesulfonate monooxygenase SsuD/methylene tetrahydromethanopterin reductase-like flavin-dependent oxidoreductase (luciferase family)
MTTATSTLGGERVPALDEEPEIVKFVRTDGVQYEGAWSPAEYDPDLARQTLESHIEDAVEAEKLGLDGVLLTEHHFDAWTLVPSPNLFLVALAMRTQRLRLGQAVNVLPIHSPWRLAEETGMLDIISNGRAEVGFGKGNFSIERTRYTPPDDEFDDRFNEGLELFTRALRENDVVFDGKYTKISLPSTVYPKPFNPEMRAWCAGLRPESIEHIARAGHNLYGFLTPDAGDNLKLYLDAAHEAGHERSGANFMVIVSLIIAPTDTEAKRIQDQAMEVAWDAMMHRSLPLEEAEFYHPVFGGAIIGSPQTVLEQLGPAFEATGARRLNLVWRLRGLPEPVGRQTQHLFCTEVMPHLRHLPVTVPA